jgi:hypothetical protein
MAKQFAHPHFARHYFVAALGWDQPLLEVFIANMKRGVYTKWIAAALYSDNLPLLQKANPGAEQIPKRRRCWTIGGSPETPSRRSIVYGVQETLEDGKLWINRWVGSKRSKLQSAKGMGLAQVIEMDLEALETLSQIGHWFEARGVAASETLKKTAIYRLGQLEVSAKLAARNHRVSLTLRRSHSSVCKASADYSMRWHKDGFAWDQEVFIGNDMAGVVDGKTAERRTGRSTIFLMLELLDGAQANDTKEV